MPDKDLRDPIPRVSEEDYQDYEFILSDLQHNLELSPEKQIERFRADPWGAFSGLKAANGLDLPLSREAQERFTHIATRGLKNLGRAAQAHRLEKVVEALKGELSSMLRASLVPSVEDAHELFCSAVRKLEGEYVELTYHVPCSVVAARSYAEFTIGPVTFLLRDQFLKQNESAIQQSAAKFKNPRVTEVLLARTHAFYSEFQWIASLTVPRCDSEVSRRRAHAGIQKALDVFKLIVGSQRASHVKQAYDFTAPSKYVELVSSSTGSFSLRSGGKLQDAVLNDHWYEQSLRTSQHVLEMFRRTLLDGRPRRCLDRLANRLTKIVAEALKLASPEE